MSAASSIFSVAHLWVTFYWCTPGYSVFHPGQGLWHSFHHPLSGWCTVLSLGVGLGLETSIHCEALPGFHSGSLYVMLCPADYTGKVSEDWQGINVNGMDLVLPTELTLQNLSFGSTWMFLRTSFPPPPDSHVTVGGACTVGGLYVCYVVLLVFYPLILTTSLSLLLSGHSSPVQITSL